MSEDLKPEMKNEVGNKNMRFLELIVMIIIGFFTLLPLILYGYHFFI